VVSQIARSLRIATQTVRNTFSAFEAEGLAATPMTAISTKLPYMACCSTNPEILGWKMTIGRWKSQLRSASSKASPARK
jgi:hypothetical protein